MAGRPHLLDGNHCRGKRPEHCGDSPRRGLITSMYYRHFGLDSSPFRFVPVGRDLYLGRCHREALAALEWGVLHEPSGFTLLIGEAGTGKTTLVKSILARNYAQVRAACINNPKLGFDGILRE